MAFCTACPTFAQNWTILGFVFRHRRFRTSQAMKASRSRPPVLFFSTKYGYPSTASSQTARCAVDLTYSAMSERSIPYALAKRAKAGAPPPYPSASSSTLPIWRWGFVTSSGFTPKARRRPTCTSRARAPHRSLERLEASTLHQRAKRAHALPRWSSRRRSVSYRQAR